ncbi:ABC transporter substrate-binding protein [Rhodoluna limnophila]|uniref:ABC transporter substrate-binding protein n=1 Tax=Rhodoluna limnophila TaxID=232537 RepID=UPI001105CA46|nr:ABC transporter substrate-binding protein [Rhodoluna limnophila]
MKRRLLFVATLACIGLGLASCTSNSGQPSPSPSQSSHPLVDAEARAALPASIRNSGLIRVAIDATYPPNEFKAIDGSFSGWEVELVEQIANKLGVSVRFQNYRFDSIIPAVEANRVDTAVSSMFDTPERRMLVDMVNYYSAGSLWAQKSGQQQIDPRNACGLRIAVQSGIFQEQEELPARSQQCLDQGRAELKVLSYDNQQDASEALLIGRVDAFVADSPVTLYAVKQSGSKLKAIEEPYDLFDYSFPVAKGSSLAKALQLATQASINDGTYRTILASWGVQAGAMAQATVNGEE